jgi:CRISPR-associated protein Cas1
MNYGDASNLCLSTANNCLYGICHSAILSLGYSTAIGFIHEGHQTSFVFDIADLYKVEVSIPIAFSCVSEDNNKSMNNTRIKMRDYFNDNKFLKRVVNDIEDILS